MPQASTPPASGSGRRRDLIIGCTTVAFFAVVLLLVIPNQIRVPARIAVLALSPAFWPTTVALMGIVLGLIVAARGLTGISPEDHEDSAGNAEPRQDWRSLAAVALMFAYLGLVHVLGIVLASSLAVVALAWLFRERRLLLVLPVAVVLPLALYYFFTLIAHIPLPLGVFERFA